MTLEGSHSKDIFSSLLGSLQWLPFALRLKSIYPSSFLLAHLKSLSLMHIAPHLLHTTFEFLKQFKFLPISGPQNMRGDGEIRGS